MSEEMACIWLLSSWDKIFLPYAVILINFHNQKLQKYEKHKVHEEECFDEREAAISPSICRVFLTESVMTAVIFFQSSTLLQFTVNSNVLWKARKRFTIFLWFRTAMFKGYLRCKANFCHKVALNAQQMNFFIWNKKNVSFWRYLNYCDLWNPEISKSVMSS